ncbi:hypothetical protein FJZ21_00780 [Candidatus Pacearchaeota archaeon]|nr:hypothetical protein [Candidatus Pacearchaeota archaeon]
MSKERTILTKKTLAGALVGQLAHFSVCPMHGLPAILFKTGLISGAIAAPFMAVNNYLVNQVTPIVSTVRGDNTDYTSLPPLRYDRRTRTTEYVDSNRQIASDIVDYSGWALALGIPLLILLRGVYKNRNLNQHRTNNYDKITMPFPEEII